MAGLVCAVTQAQNLLAWNIQGLRLGKAARAPPVGSVLLNVHLVAPLGNRFCGDKYVLGVGRFCGGDFE